MEALRFRCPPGPSREELRLGMGKIMSSEDEVYSMKEGEGSGQVVYLIPPHQIFKLAQSQICLF